MASEHTLDDFRLNTAVTVSRERAGIIEERIKLKVVKPGWMPQAVFEWFVKHCCRLERTPPTWREEAQ